MNKKLQQIKQDIRDSKLNSAIQLLLDVAQNLYPALISEIQTVASTYEKMLSYYVSGTFDPMQNVIYEKIKKDLLRIHSQLQLNYDDLYSNKEYYAKRRSLKSEIGSFKEIHQQLVSFIEIKDLEQVDAKDEELFNLLWTLDTVKQEPAQEITALLKDEKITPSIKAHASSAIFLSLWEIFDEAKLNLLYTFCFNKDPKVQMRSLTNLFLVIYRYEDRLTDKKEWENKLSLINSIENIPDLSSIAKTIALQFILAKQTQSITETLQKDILPKMMEMAPEMKKFNIDDLNDDNSFNEINPEWLEQIKDSELGNKLQKISELQSEGADVMHSTFMNFKGFPFFKEVAHWFLPFNFEHAALSHDKEMKNLLNSEILKPVRMQLCDSDSYSLFFMLQQMPEAMRKNMLSGITDEMSAMIEQELSEQLSHKISETERIIRFYIRDLYRFFMLYHSKEDFVNPFETSLDFHSKTLLSPAFKDSETLYILCESYFKKNFFNEAKDILFKLIEREPNNGRLLQQLGFCFQRLGDYSEALEYYLKADLITPNNAWLIKRIANCYKIMGKPLKAIAYYKQYEKIKPDDINVQINIGLCLLDANQYEEALKYLFKVDYLKPNNKKVKRPLAWCCFMTRKFEKAHTEYESLLKEAPHSTEDLLNAGHTEMARGNTSGATQYYKEAITNSNFDSFLTLMNQDRPVLYDVGISDFDINLILDYLMTESKK